MVRYGLGVKQENILRLLREFYRIKRAWLNDALPLDDRETIIMGEVVLYCRDKGLIPNESQMKYKKFSKSELKHIVNVIANEIPKQALMQMIKILYDIKLKPEYKKYEKVIKDNPKNTQLKSIYRTLLKLEKDNLIKIHRNGREYIGVELTWKGYKSLM